MAIKNFLFSPIALSLLFLTLSACQTTASRRPQPRLTGVEVNAPTEHGTAPSVIEPPPTREEAKKVAVILGPGGAKAMAHVGVLRAFQQQRIP
ncbi:MAG: hypothetical protein ACXVA9_04560, partial [Bdellovibrionales bacterium]